MIARLKGVIVQKKVDSLILDVSGVGYDVKITTNTFSHLPADDDSVVTLFIHTAVREDALELFGFLEEKEKALFKLLVSVSGIGPKLARNVLSGTTTNDLINAIRNGETVRLNALPGVGKKTSERIVIDLKDKVLKAFDVVTSGVDDALTSGAATTGEHGAVLNDVLSALINMGYKPNLAEMAVKKAKTILTGDESFEAAFKACLKGMSGK